MATLPIREAIGDVNAVIAGAADLALSLSYRPTLTSTTPEMAGAVIPDTNQMAGFATQELSKKIKTFSPKDRIDHHHRALGTRLPWKQMVARHEKPVLLSSVWQLLNSLIPYLALWGLMVWTLDISYWLTLAIAVPAAGFLVRIFIIFHDCSHGSFMPSRRGNRFWGFVTGVLTFTPFHPWRQRHAMHHATSGDLDRRGTGDIWTLTVEEYLRASRWKRLAYRLARNPLVLFVLAPVYLFLIVHRFPSRTDARRERRSVHGTNGALAGIAVLMSLTIGVKAYLLIQLPVITLAAVAGIWLFYVQHQFEGAYWQRREDWDYVDAALRGSSFYKLPKVLQWFTGNIGFHHIHHLSPGIPNYNLEKCHKANPLFREVKPVTLWSSRKSLSFRLWDEQRNKLTGFGRIRALRKQENRGSLI
jgi:omega-6 fatty acid desaturase (delta-12 desaturase)